MFIMLFNIITHLNYFINIFSILITWKLTIFLNLHLNLINFIVIINFNSINFCYYFYIGVPLRY